LTFLLLEALCEWLQTTIGHNMTTATLYIKDMTCASCVVRVERALTAVKGVRKASVNLATEAAQVDFNEPANLATLMQTLDKAGYPAKVAQTTLQVSDMTCASCVGRVERALAASPGVISASVNLATETATLHYAEGATDPISLAAVSTALGYPARPAEAMAEPPGKEVEAAALQRLTLIAAALTVPVFLLEMGGHIVPAFHHFIERTIGLQTSWVLQFLLTTLVLAWPGRGFYRKGLVALWRAAPDMNSLVALGTMAAWGFSTIATFAPGLLPEAARAVYFEAAAVIVTLILLGRMLEARAKGRTGAAIRRLVGLRPQTARVERGGAVVDLALGDVVMGDLLHLRPGERVAVDGLVKSGTSYVDESMITGEPAPVAKAEGAMLTGGTVNGSAALTYQATRVGADTLLAQIIRMVQDAQGAKLPVQALVDRITLWFVPVVIGLAVLTVIAWLTFGPTPVIGHALVAGVAVLIIACPCAMGLATPTSIMVGTGRAAELGVLFRKGDALQALQSVRTVAFDKTGTLTQGRPELTDLIPLNGFTEDDVLTLLAAAESTSEHPIAAALMRAAKARGLVLPATSEMAAIPGYGLSALIDGHRVLVGAARLMDREGVAIEPDEAAKLGAQGKTPLYLAVDGKLAALAAVADPVKPDAEAAVAALQDMGLTVAMITGDAQTTADYIAAALGISEIRAEVLPGGKVDALKSLPGPVAFVGDGINDAPALASASVGIAIGTGTDVAIEAGDVVLMSGDPMGVVRAIGLSGATMRNIRQNLFWAFGYNALLIPVAAGVLYPINGTLLSPALAAGAMALSSFFVLSNALRLRRAKGTLA
jgi:Cu+-exporting ATPase